MLTDGEELLSLSTGRGGGVAVLPFSPGAAVDRQHFSLKPCTVLVCLFVYLLGIFLSVSCVQFANKSN